MLSIFIGYKFFLNGSVAHNETQFNNPILTEDQTQQNNEYNEYLDNLKKEVENEFNTYLKSKLENWSLYIADPESYDKQFGSTDGCGGTVKVSDDFVDYIKKSEKGPVYKLPLKYRLYLVYTPNYNYWSTKKFLSFTSDDMGICGVGGPMRISATADKVLWINGMCGGAGGPDCDQNYFLLELIKDYFIKN